MLKESRIVSKFLGRKICFIDRFFYLILALQVNITQKIKQYYKGNKKNPSRHRREGLKIIENPFI